MTVVALALSMSACGDDDVAEPAVTSSPVSETTAASTSVAATTLAPPAPEPTVTTAPATTTTTEAAVVTTTTSTMTSTPTTAPAALTDPWVLRPDGLGGFDFGVASTAAVLAALAAEPTTGGIVSDVTDDYPFAEGGRYVTGDGELAFAHPFGRVVCHGNGLCVEFGGDSAPDVFVGWTHGRPMTGDAFETADEITTGSRWSDHLGTMDVFPGGCFAAGSGVTAGIDLVVISDDVPFSAFTGSGYEEFLPEPSMVTVESLGAGDRQIFLFADC